MNCVTIYTEKHTRNHTKKESFTCLDYTATDASAFLLEEVTIQRKDLTLFETSFKRSTNIHNVANQENTSHSLLTLLLKKL